MNFLALYEIWAELEVVSRHSNYLSAEFVGVFQEQVLTVKGAHYGYTAAWSVSRIEKTRVALERVVKELGIYVFITIKCFMPWSHKHCAQGAR
jgi:hypothetical protein